MSGLAFQAMRPFEVSEEHPLYTVIDGMLCSKDGKTLIAGYCPKPNEAVTIPEGIEIIGEGAFHKSLLGEIIMPDSVREIRASAFDGCTALTKITFSEQLETIGERAFAACSVKNLILPPGLQAVGPKAFYFAGIRWLEFTGETATIGESAFENCASLESVHFHEGLREIERYAFDNTPKLEIVSLPDSLRKLDIYAFGYSYENEEAKAFTMIIGSQLKEVNAQSFVGLNITAFEVSAENPYLSSRDGLLMDHAGRTLIAVPRLTEGTVTVPDGTYKFGYRAFAYCPLVEDILIPASVKCMNRAFEESAFALTRIPTIHVEAGSAAEKWAIERGWPYTVEP